MSRILVVDDHADARYLLASLLGGRGHEVLEAENGAHALEVARQHRPELVLSDILMPVMDGFELCNELRRDPQLHSVRFMFYSATYTQDDEQGFARAVGSDEYLVKPTDPARLLAAVDRLLDRQPESDPALATAEFWPQHRSIVLRKLEQKVAELEEANEALRHGEARLRNAMSATVVAIGRLVEYRDPYTAGHQRRVGEVAAEIGRAMALDEGTVEGLRVGGNLHDVGKIFAPAEILTRPSRLAEMEFAIVRAHARVGYNILEDLDFPWPVARMALQHHERWDGSGYPDGVAGDAILLEARIIGVADVVEAMASHRPYRPGLGIDAALAEIEAGAGVRYDPAVAQACLRLFRERGYKLPA